jgi:hypothetical protein
MKTKLKQNKHNATTHIFNFARCRVHNPKAKNNHSNNKKSESKTNSRSRNRDVPALPVEMHRYEQQRPVDHIGDGADGGLLSAGR